MKQYIPCRIAALQDKLRERGLDAALIYDRENLIYFAGISDLEGGVLCVPSNGTAELFCLWMEATYFRRTLKAPWRLNGSTSWDWSGPVWDLHAILSA